MSITWFIILSNVYWFLPRKTEYLTHLFCTFLEYLIAMLVFSIPFVILHVDTPSTYLDSMLGWPLILCWSNDMISGYIPKKIKFFLLTVFFLKFICYFWLCWVFVSGRGLSPVVASGSHSSSRCAGLSLLRPLLLRSTGSRCAGSAVVAHGPSCSTACGIFPDQGSNPCPLHRQADSQPLRHQGSLPTVCQLVFLHFFLHI